MRRGSGDKHMGPVRSIPLIGGAPPIAAVWRAAAEGRRGQSSRFGRKVRLRQRSMPTTISRFALALRLALLAFAALTAALLDVSDAFAQANACGQLQTSLTTLERNGDFRNLDQNSGAARQLQIDLQRSESAYVSQGCNADAKAGRKLSSQCRALARRITTGRDQFAQLGKSLDTGNAIAQQREAILQEITRFGCDRNSSVQVDRRDRGNLFDQLFDLFNGDNNGNVTRGDEFNPYGGYHTVRTLCVRMVDGFYWPISYSTLIDYVANDLQQCHDECPDLDVDLYYYDNPGQEPEDMVNMQGDPYKILPSAFKFRTDFDRTARCKPEAVQGTITLADLDDGRTRAMVNYGDDIFPFPIRDPRVPSEAIVTAPLQVAEVIDVPLPRPRPAAPGEEPRPVAVEPATTTASQTLRIVQFGDKQVRVVGPVTPYAPQAAAGG
jgi:hypothetical protein